MLPNQPGNTTASSVAASTAVAKQESDYSKSQLLTVELRMYLSGGKVNIIARSEHPDFYKYTELAFPESEWDSMNFKSFKEALKQKEWPSLSAGAYVYSAMYAYPLIGFFAHNIMLTTKNSPILELKVSVRVPTLIM